MMLHASALLALAAAANSPWFEPVVGDELREEGVWRGVAWNDLDGDGDADLVATRSGGISIYRNDRGKLVRLPRAVEADGISAEGVALIDIDADRRVDIFAANLAGPPRLYRNIGNVRFEALQSDIDRVTAPTHAGCFADFDGDGWLDVALITRDGADDLVFRNDRGRLRLAEDALRGSGGDGRTCAVGDWNGDRLPDLYVGNFLDSTRGARRRAIDALYANEGSFRFRSVTEGHPVNLPSMTYGATAIDWNEDGLLDLAVTHDGRADRNVLYENRSSRTGELDLYPRGEELMLATIQRGPSKGQVLADFDNDGDLDVFYSEGTEGLTAANAPFDARDELYERVGDRFVHRQEAAVDSESRLGAGAAHADFDRDGDVDLVVANWGGRVGEAKQLYRNRSGGRSVSFVLVGKAPNTQGIGAHVRLTVSRAGKQVTRHAFLWPQTGYGSMAEPVAHFGLGTGDVPRSVTVEWNDGSRTLQDVSTTGRVRVRQPDR